MNSLTQTNKEGTTFNYTINGEYVDIVVIKGGASNKYKTYATNLATDGLLNVCRVDGSWVAMPVFDSTELNNFLKSRVLHSFETLSELREFQNNNDCGATFEKDGKHSVYSYNKGE